MQPGALAAELFGGAIALVVGLLFGSLAGICVYRIPRHISIPGIRSFCPQCGKRLRWFELIPVLSFLMQGGQCRSCSAPISWAYPILELVSAFCTTAMFARFGLTGTFLIHWTFFLTMLIAGTIDWDCQTIPNPVLISAAVVGVLLALIVPGRSTAEALISGIFSLGVVLLIRAGAQIARRPEWIGVGDVKLAGVLGLFLGWKLFLLTLVLSSIACALYRLIWKKRVADKPIPLGSFMAAVAVPLFCWDEVIVNLLSQ